MRISRRNFLSVTGTAVTLFAFGRVGLIALDSEPKFDVDCALLDLGTNCSLRESLQGYQAALASKHRQVLPAELNALSRCRVAIVPGAGMIDATLASVLSGLLQSGSTLLLECGAGFLNESGFASYQRMLHQYFDITIDRPVELWRRSAYHAPLKPPSAQHPRNKPDHRQAVPYVHYRWPSKARVRDFSRAIPVSAPAGSVIGKIGDLRVAWKRRLGKGILIFLGSPMGPALLANDCDARNWLHSVIVL